MYDEVIEKLSLDRLNLIESKEMYGLGNNVKTFLNLIKEGREQEVDGEQVFNAKQEIGETQEDWIGTEEGVERGWKGLGLVFERLCQ